MTPKLALAALFTLLGTPALAANQLADITCETTTTAGTGTVSLGGALTGGYLAFVTTVTSGNSVPYSIITGTGGSRKVETGRGTFTDGAPDTLTRVADWSSDGAGAELTLSGTSTVCAGTNAALFNGDKGDITISAGFGTFTIDSTFFANTHTWSISQAFEETAATTSPVVLRNATDNASVKVLETIGNGRATPTDNDETYWSGLLFGDQASTVEFARQTVIATDVNNGTSYDGNLQWSVMTAGTLADELQLSGAELFPVTDNGLALGRAGNKFSGIYLVEGAGIDWDTSDCILSQSGDTLSTSGCTISLASLASTVKTVGKQTIWVPAAGMTNNATSPASCGDTYDSGSNDLTVRVCAFDTGATEERADFQIAMPKSWNESTVTFQPISTCAGCAAAETIQFELACVAISNDDTLNAAMGTAQNSSATVTAVNDSHVGAESSAITCAGTPAESDYVAFRISRNTSADNAAGDALLLGVKVYYTDDAANDN